MPSFSAIFSNKVNVRVSDIDMRTLLLLSAFFPGLLSAEIHSRILTPVESPPKVVDGLEFSVVTQSEWRNPDHLIHQSEPIILQLRVTNPSERAILFPTFDSFLMGLTKNDGTEVRLGGGRDATRITPHLLLKPGTSFSLNLDAALVYDQANEDVKLVVKDGTGTVITAVLSSGDYFVFFKVHPTHSPFAKKVELPEPLWAGKGTSAPVGFKVKAR